MKIIRTIKEMREAVKLWQNQNMSIGLVPTMGFLHEGHASLIKQCRKDNQIVVVSVFVNPTQFGPNEDLQSYPRDLKKDKALCESMGVDVIFHPTPEEMYIEPRAYVSIRGLADNLCGLTRPIHFSGVCTVVSKLFHIIKPERAYFGEKDAQQLAIIRKMVSDLNFDVEIIGCPIIRESDGLAKSSRNTYLSEEERMAALSLSRAVFSGKAAIYRGMKSTELILLMSKIIQEEPLAKIDYISVVDAKTMENIEVIEGTVLVAMAVYIGKTRLIDNFIFNGEKLC